MLQIGAELLLVARKLASKIGELIENQGAEAPNQGQPEAQGQDDRNDPVDPQPGQQQHQRRQQEGAQDGQRQRE